MAKPTRGKRGRPPGDQDGRARIIRAAARLFREKGFDGTTVREIAAATGMQSGSLFYFFASKEEILFAVIDQGMKQVHDAVAEARKDVSPIVGFRAMLHRHLEGILDKESDHMNVMLYETRSFPATTAEQVRHLRRGYEAMWETQIEDLIRERRWRHPGEPRLSRMALMGALNWSAQWFRPNLGDSIEALAEIICELFLLPEAPAVARQNPKPKTNRKNKVLP